MSIEQLYMIKINLLFVTVGLILPSVATAIQKPVPEKEFSIYEPRSHSQDLITLRKYNLLVGRGANLMSKGKFDTAIPEFEEAILLQPNQAIAFHLLGIVYLAQKKYDKSIVQQNKAIKIDPEFADAYGFRGDSYMGLNQHEAAIGDYTSFISLQGNFTSTIQVLDQIYFRRADSYRKLGMLKNAISDYNKVVELNPDSKDIFLSRGATYVKLKKYDLAMEDYNNEISKNPHSFKVYVNRGILYRKIGKIDLSLVDLNKAIEIQPNEKAFSYRARLFARLKNYEMAIKDAKQSISLNPNKPSPYNTIAWLYAAASDPKYHDGEQAVKYAIKACVLSKWKVPGSIDTLAAAYARNSQFDKSVEWQQKAMELARENKKEELLDGMQKRLVLYRNQQPYIE